MKQNHHFWPLVFIFIVLAWLGWQEAMPPVNAATVSGLVANPVSSTGEPPATPDAVILTETVSLPAFGPHLFLIQVDPSALPAALPPTVLFHTQVGPSLFVASGGVDDAASLQTAGVPVQVLDTDTSGKLYYFFDAQAPDATQYASLFGTPLYTDTAVAMMALPPQQELAFVETLAAHGVSVWLLSSDTLTFSEAVPADENALAAALALPADATIATLINQIGISEVYNIIADLSGERIVNVGGVNVTIPSRYTFATSMRHAEKYLYEYYGRLGYNVSYYNWVYGNYSGRNVVAEVRGAQHPERIWLIGGHFDAISENPYVSAPGADDNGTGTAMTLAMARILQGRRFADTVRFIHFSGEEQGQWGSKVYARDRKARGEQILGFINIDMIGYDGNRDRVMEIHTGYGPRSNQLGLAYIAANQRYGQGLVIEHKSSTASRFSDHSPFWDNNFPAFLAIENFYNDGALPHDHLPWYHTTGDLVGRVDLDYTLRIGRTAMAQLLESAVLLNGDPPPPPTGTPPPPPTPSPTPDPTGCTNLLVNGNGEAAGGWQFGTTPYSAATVNAPVHAGLRALRLGIPSGVANRQAHSSAFQRVTIPSNARQVVLRYWQQTGGDGDSNDYRQSLLLTPQYGVIRNLERSTSSGNNQWIERSFDLTAQRGQTLIVYFNVYNNGNGGQKWAYLDDVALLACASEVLRLEESPQATPGGTIPGGTIPTQGQHQVYLPAVSRD